MTRSGNGRLDRDDADAIVAGDDREERDEGGAELGRDEALQRAVVVRAKRVVDGMPRVAQELLGLEPARAGARADQRRARRDRRASTTSAPPCGCPAGSEEDVRVAHQLERVEGPVGQRAPSRTPGRAGRSRSPRRAPESVRRLREPELDLRPVGAEPPHHLGQHARADALVRPDAQRPGLAGAQREHVGPGGGEAVDDRLGVTKEQRSGLGHRDRARPAGALDEPLADDALERRDLLADRRLRVAELRGGAAERAGARDGLERREVPDLDAEPVVGGRSISSE